ncbi:MAG TPA: hypothetical protein VF097_08345 [Actinomycetota bacterium]
MSANLCSRCGRPLRDGVCPVGHPQRVARRRRRRPWRATLAIVIVIALLAGAAYAALIWYPPRAAGDAIRPLSTELARTVPLFRQTVEALPSDSTPEALSEASAVLTAADEARSELTRLQGRLETTSVPSIPVISDRPPMETASRVHAQMSDFAVGALETVGDLEASARYLTELAAILPSLANLRAAVGSPVAPGEVEGSVAASRPIAEQLRADLRSLTPPEELSETHATLLAIARGLGTSIDELEATAGAASGPVIRAIVADIRSQISSFRETAGAAPQDARTGGLSDQIEDAERRLERIVAGLRELEDQGVEDLTIPDA